MIHDFDVYFAIRISDQTYCGDFETPVLNEIDDLMSCNGKDVPVVLKDKEITVFTPKSRKLKARIVKENQC